MANESIGAFMEFKKIRDAMIHARIINASIGIGLSEKTRGEKSFELLLTEESLTTFYDHIVMLEKELSSLGSLLGSMNAIRASTPGDPNRSQSKKQFEFIRLNFGRIAAFGYH